MKSKSDHFLGDKGTKLHYRYWFPDYPEKVLAIVHGLGEHSGRYQHVAEKAVADNIAVYAIDLRGHGKSAGKKGHTPSYQSLMNDIEEFLKTIRSNFTDLPVILYGHSMGGNLVLNYLLRMNTNELSGYILSAPYLELAFAPPAWKVKIAGIVGSVLPGLTQPNGLVVNHISKINEEVAKYLNDPLVHGKITVSLYLGIASGARFGSESTKVIGLPGFILHGGKDQIVSPEGSRKLAARQPNAELKIYPDAYHEPHNDVESEDVISDIVAWTKK